MPALPNLTLCRSAEESMAINQLRGGAIVIAGSGMCTGGRIVHHLRHNLRRRECDVIFTGYQAVGTLGRALVDGRRGSASSARKSRSLPASTRWAASPHMATRKTCCAGMRESGASRTRSWCTAKARCGGLRDALGRAA